ncbi:protein ALTERED PHOSPHATE STARVATION RESPONSE 1-like [Nicotiana tomentosiformis]|uniref:protein ALTERED PHOSPHATE STARVATION RESPONSE 1-like n=1 Tax=Nicotiana tomentosiformis TaxID=4098 RepID=UPI00051ACEE4|nr:protein ALTERED PHOSPHATE STARVATION RESPONSE 1-like [Nicotiana tomentosiformis]
MGCVASKLEQEEEVVSICKERKHQLKLAVERRYTLADAHYKYCQALYGVSAALKLFVARHSTPTSPYLITFPPPCPSSPPKEKVVSNPLFLQQTPSEPTQESICCGATRKSTTTPSDSSEEEDRVEKVETQQQQQQQQQPGYGYFYMEMPQMVQSPPTDFGWDFFNPFNSVRPEIISGYHRISEEDIRAVREQEGIPDLEEEEEEEGNGKKEENKVVATAEKENVEHRENGSEVVQSVHTANVNQEDRNKGLTVVDNPLQGRELLEALTDIEDHFVKAYDSGKEVSRMLEANWVHSQPNLGEPKDNSTKMIPAITWKSPSSRSSSCKSLVASSSKSSSTWTEFKNDLFDEYGGMGSGSHSLTLGRLYAWEKKLYEEVKAGDSTWKLYEKKCNQLRNHDSRGDEGRTTDKTRAAVKELYSRILVAIRSAETISTRIEKLRDEELQPQIIELLQGMMRTWKIMLESHEIQNKIIFDVKSFTCPTYGKFCNDSHRLATLQLDVELQNWRTRFQDYIAAQKAYVEALHGWLSKFTIPEVEFYSKRRSSIPQCRANGPPLLMICHDWLSAMNKLPDRAVSVALKGCGKDVRALWVQQGEEQQQKLKVDSMSKELDRKTLAFQKVENKLYEFKLTDRSSELEVDHRAEYLKERKDLLDNFRKRVDLEKEEHQKCMQETQRITLNGFQTGFCRVFESIAEFSSAALKMYNELLSSGEKAEKVGNPPSIESSQAGEDVKR